MANDRNPYNVGRTLSLRVFGDCPMPGRRTHVARDYHDQTGMACCRCHKTWWFMPAGEAIPENP